METVKKKEFTPEYRTPMAKVVKIEINNLLCFSPQGTVGEQDDPTEVDRD